SARELASDLRRVSGDTARDSREAIGMHSAPTIAQAVTDGSTERGAPTANTYSTSVGVEKPRSSRVAWLLGGVIAAVAVAGGVAFLMKRQTDQAEAEAAASATAHPIPEPPAVAAAPAPPV